MSYRLCVAGILSAVVLSMFACAALGQTPNDILQSSPAPDIVPPSSWLSITSCKFVAHLSGSKDTFAAKGTFSLAPSLLSPASNDVTVTIGTKQFVFAASTWKRAGASSTYKAKLATGVGTVSAEITYCVGGSSRCTFAIAGSKQDISTFGVPFTDQTGTVDFPVEVKVGSVLDVVAELDMWVTVNTAARTGTGKLIGNDGAQAAQEFPLDRVLITRNLKKANADSITVIGRVYDPNITPPSDSFQISIGSFSANIPTSALTKHGSTMTGNWTLPGGGKGKVTVKPYINDHTPFGTFMARITGVDLSSVTNPATLTVAVVGPDTVTWTFDVTFQENKAGTTYRY